MSCAAANVITKTEIVDLELISRNNGEQGGIHQVLDRAISAEGHKRAKELLTSPITDISKLKARQRFIEELKDPALRTSLTQQLMIIKKNEPSVHRIFDKQSREQLAIVFKKNYYQLGLLKGLNQSAIALDIAHILEFCSLFGPLIEHLILHFALDKIQELASPQKDKHGHKHKDHHHKDHHHKDHHHKKGHSCASCLISTDESSPYWLQNLATALKVGHLVFHLFNIKEMVEHLVSKADVINMIHQEIINTYACIQACARIASALKDSSLAAAGIDSEALLSLCSNQTQLVVDSLENRFEENNNNNLDLFSRVGPTLAAYAGFQDHEATIMNILHAAGSVDAMLGISSLMTEKPHQYVFAEFVESSSPYVELENFSHPQIESATPNSITMSQPAKNLKLTVTGPNKAGKSSTTKSIAVNLILAQTFGIACATKAVISPMHRIITYINLHDNLATNASMFVTEIMRADSILQELSTLSETVPTFALFDDSLFRSTQPTEGEIAAYRFAKKIITLPVCAIFVTHYESLTKLEEETSGKMKNYRIGLQKNILGQSTSSYVLEPGISPRNEIFSIVAHDTYQSDLLAFQA